MQEDEIPYKFEAPGLKMFHKNQLVWGDIISTASPFHRSRVLSQENPPGPGEKIWRTVGLQNSESSPNDD